MIENSNNTGLYNKYKMKFGKAPFIIGSMTVIGISFLLGIISSLVAIVLDVNLNNLLALFIDIILISLIFLLVGLLQSEYVKEKTATLIEKFKEKDSYGKIYFVSMAFLLFFLILAIPTLLSPINFLQHAIIAIITASNLILVSVGLTLTTRVRKFANFAQSEFVIIGIYVAIALEEISGGIDKGFQWIFFMMIFAFVFTGLIGVLSEILIFGPLTRRNATPLSLMVASIGLGLIVRQTIQEIFGSVPRTSSPRYPAFYDRLEGIPLIEIFFAERTKYQFFNDAIRISRDEAWTVVVMIVSVYLMHRIFTRTTMGISMRATADDPDLAQITGINTKSVIYFTWFLAAGVTGMGALFFFEAAQIQPGSGFVQLLLIFAVVILGGFDSFEGTIISGFILSFSMTTAVIFNGQMTKFSKRSDLADKMVFWSTSGDWKVTVAFAIIILVLIFRPRGIFGLVDPKSKL